MAIKDRRLCVEALMDGIMNKHKEQVNNIIHIDIAHRRNLDEWFDQIDACLCRGCIRNNPPKDDFCYVKDDILSAADMACDNPKSQEELAVCFKNGIETLYSKFNYKPIAKIIYDEVKLLLRIYNIDLPSDYFDDDPHYIKYDESLFYD